MRTFAELANTSSRAPDQGPRRAPVRPAQQRAPGGTGMLKRAAAGPAPAPAPAPAPMLSATAAMSAGRVEQAARDLQVRLAAAIAADAQTGAAAPPDGSGGGFGPEVCALLRGLAAEQVLLQQLAQHEVDPVALRYWLPEELSAAMAS